MSMNGNAPCKKMNWLKGLLDDDGDSSDATPQPKEQKLDVKPDKKLEKIARPAPIRAGINTMNDPLTGTRKQHQGGDMRAKKERYEAIGGADEEDTPGNFSTRRRSESGHLLKYIIGEKHTASSADVRDADNKQKHPRRLEFKAGKMIQHKRPHVESVVKEREKDELYLKNTVEPAKAKAAAHRQRRMKKLRARREATGEHGRLTAWKMKRQELSEASRLKRNQRMQMRKTHKPPTPADLDSEAKENGKTRPLPQSSEESQEQRLMFARQRSASIKDKKQLGVGLNSSIGLSLKLPQSVNFDVEKRELGKNEVCHGLEADYRDEGNQKRQKRKHLKWGSESAAGNGMSHVQTSSKMSEHQFAGGKSVIITKGRHEVDIFACASSNDTNTIRVSDGRYMPSQNNKSCRGKTKNVDAIEEGQVDSPAFVKKSAPNSVEQRNKADKEISDVKKDMLLDTAPIPRKSIGDSCTATSTTSFVIPKRSVKIADGKDERRSISAGPHSDQKSLGVHIPASIKPMSSLEPDPQNSQLSSRDPIRPQQKRTKSLVPVKSSMLSTQDRAFMRLARKRNSIFLAAAESTVLLSSIDDKVSAVRMTNYDVCDVYGNVLSDLIPRLSCATKSEMTSSKDSFNTSFFGVSQCTPTAKGKASSTVDNCGGVEGRMMNCYEELRFERPEDREIYQRRMYGSTFVPQYLRGRVTLILRSVRFERKSTGIRFNQDRDREEFAATLSKRYTFKKTVPRCEIPRENWQNIMRNQPGAVYLHYNNREDAERAAHVFRDDSGNPLELKNEYNSRVGSSRNHFSAKGIGSRCAPKRSSSSERSPPKASPLSSRYDSARSTPRWQREHQWITSRYSRYDRAPSAQRNGQEDNYGPTVVGRRSRSRSRSRSRLKRVPDEACAPTAGGKSDAGNHEFRTNNVFLSEHPKNEPAVRTREPFPTDKEVGNVEHQSSNAMNKSDRNGDTEANAQQRSTLPTAPSSPRTTTQSKVHHEQNLESGEEEQEDGEIESSTVSVAETIDRSKDRGRRQSSRSSPRGWRQPHDMQCHQRQEDYHDRPYTQHYDRGPSRQRSRSRSRPRPLPWGRSDRCDAWNGSCVKQRHLREHNPVHDYDSDGHGRPMYSSEMNRYEGRDYYGGGYNDRREDSYSRHYR